MRTAIEQLQPIDEAVRPSTGPCAGCPYAGRALGIDIGHSDYLVAMAGNPNTGKSTVFNAVTGLQQHVGNWPGKTVARAEGGFQFGGVKDKIVDLPGTYFLVSTLQDEET